MKKQNALHDSPEDRPFWSESIEDAFETLAASAGGLSSDEALIRLTRFGPNRVHAAESKSAFWLFLNQFRNPLVLILLAATTVSAMTQDWVSALIILLIVFGSALLSFIQEYNAGNAVEKLRKQVSIKTSVFRDGLLQSILVEQVVPGDVLQLSAGSLIPADGILIEAHDFYVNQAVLTGETYPIEKRPGIVPATSSLIERTNCIFMGTNVRSGSAKALILKTGPSTQFGEIAERLSFRPPENEFERGIRRFGYMLSQMMLILVLLVFSFNIILHKPVLDSLLFSIALAVGITPELLPAIISLNLSKGSRSMAAQGVIVRQLNAIENLGSMDILCTDKTGTLTLGIVQLDGTFDPEGASSSEVHRLAYLNARFQTGLTNPLDESILAQPPPDISDVEKVNEIPYDFIRKRLSVVVREHGEIRLITKGAVENILSVCTRVGLKEHAVLDSSSLSMIRGRFADWSAQGYRVIGVAVKEIGTQPGYQREDERDMTFIGFLLFFDPPKPGVKETISHLTKMGISLKIITGDNRMVAEHTAEAIGLNVGEIITGAELNSMHDDALWLKAGRTTLFAEVDPNQKERIILALKKLGDVVGYLGDGVNDAPSLHAADVGISVDTAVDVAKEAADFVLLEKDLDVLCRGVMLGRRTFANTLKYIQVTTSANFGNMFSMAGASIFLPFLPLLPMQILLTNFLTDFPAITIAGDNVDPEMLERPRRWDNRFIRDFMIVFGGVSSFFDYVTFGLLLWVFNASDIQFRTGWFVESVLTELLILLVIRTRRAFLKSRASRALFLATLLTILVTLILPYSPLGKTLGFAPLPVPYLLALGGVTTLYVLFTEITKQFFYQRRRTSHQD